MSATIEEVRAAYEADKSSRRPPLSVNDIPFAYEDITPEWLTAVLCADHPGARVVSCRLGPIDNGSSNRRRIFVEYNEHGKALRLPPSVFCKATQSLEIRLLTGIQGAAKAEVDFFNEVRPLLKIEAPQCHLANIDASFNSIIVMRDIADRATFCTHTTPVTRERAEAQLRTLAALHGSFLDSPELATRLSCFKTWPEFFAAFDNPAFEQACDQGFALSEEVIPPRLFARRADIWAATRASAESHRRLAQTITHGDPHMRNWYIAEGGGMGLTDWQVTNRGHWSRDVIYALTTSLAVEDRRHWLDDLIRYYVTQLEQRSHRNIPRSGVLDDMRRQLPTVLAFWTITMNPALGLADLQPRDTTLEFVRRIATAIDDLDALDSFAKR